MDGGEALAADVVPDEHGCAGPEPAGDLERGRPAVGEVGERVEAEDDVGARVVHPRVEDVAAEPGDPVGAVPRACQREHLRGEVHGHDPALADPREEVALQEARAAAEVDDRPALERGDESEPALDARRAAVRRLEGVPARGQVVEEAALVGGRQAHAVLRVRSSTCTAAGTATRARIIPGQPASSEATVITRAGRLSHRPVP